MCVALLPNNSSVYALTVMGGQGGVSVWVESVSLFVSSGRIMAAEFTKQKRDSPQLELC